MLSVVSFLQIHQILDTNVHCQILKQQATQNVFLRLLVLLHLLILIGIHERPTIPERPPSPPTYPNAVRLSELDLPR